MAFLEFFDEPTRSRPRFSPREKEALYKEQGGKCNGCGRKVAKVDLEVDHIIPLSKGGSDRFNNLQLLCSRCNSSKGDGTMAQLRKRLRQQGVVKSSPRKTAATKTARSARKTKPTSRSTPKKKRTPKRDPVEKFFDDLFRL